MKSPRAIVHIGQPKTGTKTLQTFLTRNRVLLEKNGFAYPDFLGDLSSFWLVLLPQDARPLTSDPWLNDLAEQVVGDWDVEIQARRQMLVDWAHRHGDKTLVFSCEGLSTILEYPQLLRFRDLLSDCAEEITIVVYLREPVARMISGWSTTLLAGYSQAKNLKEFMSEKADYGLYTRLGGVRGLGNLPDWEEVFPNSLRVRLFDRHHFVEGELEQDFCSVLGIPWLEEFERTEQLNQILTPQAMACIALLNQWTGRSSNDSSLRDHRNSLIAELSGIGDPSTRYKPSFDEVQDIYVDNSRAIRWVEERYFDTKFELWTRERDQLLMESVDATAGTLPDPAPLLLEQLGSRLASQSRIAVRDETCLECDQLRGQLAPRGGARSWLWTSLPRKLKSK